MKKLCIKILETNNYKVKSIKKFNSGFASVIYLADTNKGKRIVKIKLSEGNSLENEYYILKLIEKVRIGPKAYYKGSLSEKPYLIEEFIPGSRLPWKNITDVQVKLVAMFFKKIHSIKPPKEKVESFKGKYLPIDRLNYPKSLAHLNSELKELIIISEEKIKDLEINKDLVLRHGDPNPHNFLFHKNSIKAIDWEESKVGHYAIDIADFFIKANLTQKQIELFYKNYHLKNIENTIKPFVITGLLGLICWNLDRIELIKQNKLNKEIYKSMEDEELKVKFRLKMLRKLLNS